MLARLLAESRKAYGACGDYTRFFASRRDEARSTRVRGELCSDARDSAEMSTEAGSEAAQKDVIRRPRARHLARIAVGSRGAELALEGEWWRE